MAKQNTDPLSLINKEEVIEAFEKCLPVPDVMQWVIDRYPENQTKKILELFYLIRSSPRWKINYTENRRYETKFHFVTGRRLEAEKNSELNQEYSK